MPLALRGKPGLGVGVLGGGGGFPRREAWEVGMKGAMKDNQIDRQSESWSISMVVSQLMVILNILGCTRIPAPSLKTGYPGAPDFFSRLVARILRVNLQLYSFSNRRLPHDFPY